MSAGRAYRQTEKAIAAADHATIWQRWDYARRLLCDPSATTPDGILRPGKMAELVDEAAKAGVKLTEAEIEQRLAAGRAYKCESQILDAGREHGTWSDLEDAGFPEFPAAPGEKPYDPRSAAQRAQQAERQLALGEPDQGVLFQLFPDDRFDALSTLEELAKWAAESESITRRFQDRDRKRAEYLARLADAVDGDMGRTWAEAQAALDAKDGQA